MKRKNVLIDGSIPRELQSQKGPGSKPSSATYCLGLSIASRRKVKAGLSQNNNSNDLI